MHAQQIKSASSASPVGRFPSSNPQRFQVVQLRDARDELRAVKARVAEAYGFRMGGAPLKQIASDMGVTVARAGELLDVTHPRRLSDEYLARIARNNPAMGAKLGVAGISLPLAGEGMAA
jgi:hypothetical protein